MAQEKRALWVWFKPKPMLSTAEMREMFIGSYPAFRDMDPVEYKCWWVDQEDGQWGAFYVFKDAASLDEYLASDRWNKVIPEKYGCVPEWRVLEPGPIVSKAVITEAEGSW